MPCYRPLKGWRSHQVNPSGKRQIVFKKSDGYNDQHMDVPCGQCIGCRLEKSRQWAIRCMHEASLYDDNCFITLTYAPEHLPPNGSLDKKAFPLFMKRLRKKFGANIKYYHCGEYGDQYSRPHYHACIFNFDFSDKVLYSEKDKIRLYESPTLSGNSDSLWPFGHATIGDVTFESAAYTARYVMKKVTGKGSDEFYTRINPETGKEFKLVPEYTTMSRRPGIGKKFLEKYSNEIYPEDEVIVRGRPMLPPKFYDKEFEKEDPKLFKKVKLNRKLNALKNEEHNTDRRLYEREVIKKQKTSDLIRNYEREQNL